MPSVDTAGRSRYDNPLLIGPAYRLEAAEPVTLQSGAVLARHTIGFETYGTEPHAMKVDESYVDEDHMILQVH